jgi:hypothetical protein
MQILNSESGAARSPDCGAAGGKGEDIATTRVQCNPKLYRLILPAGDAAGRFGQHAGIHRGKSQISTDPENDWLQPGRHEGKTYCAAQQDGGGDRVPGQDGVDEEAREGLAGTLGKLTLVYAYVLWFLACAKKQPGCDKLPMRTRTGTVPRWYRHTCQGNSN